MPALAWQRERADVPWDDPDALVVNPVKLVREAWMANELLTELRRAPLGDERARLRFRSLARQLLVELGSALSERTAEELDRFIELPFGHVPSDIELRLLQAQVVGWLEGLLAAAEMAAAVEAEEASSASEPTT